MKSSFTTTLKFLRLAVCIAFCLVSFEPVAQTRPKLAMVTHGQAGDPFWLVVRNGAEAGARETNCDLEYRSPEHFDLAEMSRFIDEAVASKPDGLIVSIPDVAIVGPSIRRAVAAGIPVISINTGLNVSKGLGCLMHIGQEDELAGRKAGEQMKATGVKNALILNQEVGNSGLDQRIKGFKAGFEGPFHHVQVLPVEIDFEKCQQAVTDYLSNNSETDGIVALGPVAAEPSLEAISQLHKVGKIKVCTFDTSPKILNALVSNRLEFAVDQQQWLQGYLPVVFLANYATYGSMVQNDLILTGPSFVTPANARKALNLLSSPPPASSE
jgi:simple sugar transport system substrate-binding protein